MHINKKKHNACTWANGNLFSLEYSEILKIPQIWKCEFSYHRRLAWVRKNNPWMVTVSQWLCMKKKEAKNSLPLSWEWFFLQATPKLPNNYRKEGRVEYRCQFSQQMYYFAVSFFHNVLLITKYIIYYLVACEKR